jgi:hypothetical protein
MSFPIYNSGGNPFGNPLSSENSRPKMEFGEIRVGSNKMVQRRLYKYTSRVSSF